MIEEFLKCYQIFFSNWGDIFSSLVKVANNKEKWSHVKCLRQDWPISKIEPFVNWKYFCPQKDFVIVYVITVTYPGCLGAQYTGLGTQTLVPKKGFSIFCLKISFKHPRRRVFFKHPRRRVFHYSIYLI